MSVAAKAEPKKPSDAEIVEAYLTASMIPDPDAAAAYMKPGTLITFTGGRRIRSSARTDRLQCRALSLGQEEDGPFRRLSRRGRDRGVLGRHAVRRMDRRHPFEGNRYVDRFVVQDGFIVKMDVWNDSAERILVNRGIVA